jgi:hypothetical protein
MSKMYNTGENLHVIMVHIKIKDFYDVKQCSWADGNPLPLAASKFPERSMWMWVPPKYWY